MKIYHVIGLMSGTSLDGLDIAYVKFSFDKKWKYEIKQCECRKYSSNLKKELQQAISLSGLDLKLFDLKYGKWIGRIVKKFINTHQIKPDLLVSHGHTIYHRPDKGATVQIGDGYEIMNATGISTINDLRSLDVSNGGQGAPLVPIGDKLLFSSYEFCLNLGGFSNISFDKSGQRIAFDICPVNTVLNFLSSKIDLEFDKGGEVARLGLLNNSLLEKLNSLKYYDQPPPKSLGIEWVQKHIFPLLQINDSTENLLNTYCHHIVQQIIRSVMLYGGKKDQKPKMLISGGGAKNRFLMDLVKEESKGQLKIVRPDLGLIDFKEAIIFAFLGLLRYLGKINTLKSVTGARVDSSGGMIYDHITTIRKRRKE